MQKVAHCRQELAVGPVIRLLSELHSILELITLFSKDHRFAEGAADTRSYRCARHFTVIFSLRHSTMLLSHTYQMSVCFSHSHPFHHCMTRFATLCAMSSLFEEIVPRFSPGGSHRELVSWHDFFHAGDGDTHRSFETVEHLSSVVHQAYPQFAGYTRWRRRRDARMHCTTCDDCATMSCVTAIVG